MGLWKSHSSVKSSLATATVLQQSVEKSSALELENSKLRHHVSVLSWRLHEVIAELKVQSKIAAAFCPFCGDNHNQVDCELWMERVVIEERQLEKVEFASGVDVEPLVIEGEVALVAEKKIVVRLPVVVAESVARTEVVEDVAIVEVAGRGKEVAVVAEEVGGSVGSTAEDWTVVKRRYGLSEISFFHQGLFATTPVLQKSVEKSLALKSKNSKLRHHALVLSQRLHEVIAELKVWSKITVAFCPFCGDNHNLVDCVDWLKRVEEEDSGEEVEGVVEKRLVVRLPVAVVESVAGAEVVVDVAMVEVAGKGKEEAVVAKKAEDGVGS
ncbi:hypothetical protein HOY80DRAFT_1033822 [Tuber brumale]|nr:hypothetical protein HOY80DRAFT_1033822 [Tuber brumale]